MDLALLTAPPEEPVPEPVEPASLDRVPVEPERSEPETASRERAAVEPGTESRLGVREGLNWVAGPPESGRLPVPVGLGERVAATAGPLRSALAEPVNIAERAPTALDTLLFIQHRLLELTEEAMRKAREAPGSDPYWEPFPQPGSIQELRGSPMLPIVPLAALVAEKLAELGKAAWQSLIGFDPEAATRPDMDLTYAEVLAFAALDDYRGLNVFEWYGRLNPEFEGGLGDLQRTAARLSDRNMIALSTVGDVFVYRRLVPLQDVISYYTAFLARLPDREVTRRESLIRTISALVREHR